MSERLADDVAVAFRKYNEFRSALEFILSLAEEELQYAKVGTGSEVALRHIARKAEESLNKP